MVSVVKEDRRRIQGVKNKESLRTPDTEGRRTAKVSGTAPESNQLERDNT
jgi:hypothetical protein